MASPLCLQNASSVSLLNFLVGGRGPRASSPSLRAADLRAAVSHPFHFTLKRIYPIAGETCGECGSSGAWWPLSLKLTVRSSGPQKRPNPRSGVAGMPAGGTAWATKMFLNPQSRGHLPSFLVCPSESKNSLWGLARRARAQQGAKDHGVLRGPEDVTVHQLPARLFHGVFLQQRARQ